MLFSAMRNATSFINPVQLAVADLQTDGSRRVLNLLSPNSIPSIQVYRLGCSSVAQHRKGTTSGPCFLLTTVHKEACDPQLRFNKAPRHAPVQIRPSKITYGLKSSENGFGPCSTAPSAACFSAQTGSTEALQSTSIYIHTDRTIL